MPRGPPPPDAPGPKAPAARLPRLRDPAVVGLLAVVLGLQLYTWTQLSGYRLADSIEYLQRAELWMQGASLAAEGVVRPFVYSALLAPLFGIARLLDPEDLRWVPHAARLLQMAIGLALVLSCGRLAARLAGPPAGLAAAWLVGVNPIFLAWSVEPVSGLAAALCIALALELAVERGSTRQALGAGLLFGLAVLMAYQSVLVLLPIVLLLALRDGRRRGRHFGALGAGIALMLLVQVGLDRLVYGEWGVSLQRYLVANFGPHLTRVVLKLGMTDLAREIYSAYTGMLGYQFDAATGDENLRQLLPATWYLTNLPRMLVAPALACFALGLLRAWKRPSWGTTLLALAFLANLAVMSLKGAKSFRLWLPLLPLIAPLAAWGWMLLAGSWSGAGWTRRALSLLLLAAALPLGLRQLEQQELRRHGGYWQALGELERQARGLAAPQRVAATYPWAIYLRGGPGIEVIKPPHPLDSWGKLDDAMRREVLETLARSDWMLSHLATLENNPELFDWVAPRFEVSAACYDQGDQARLGPVLVLRRAAEGGARFYGVEPGHDPAEYIRARGLGPPRRFSLGEERLALLGFEHRLLAGSGWGWITYHWLVESPLERDWRILDRVSASDSARAWFNEHRPAYGMRRAQTLAPGTILREGYLLVPSKDPFVAGEPFRPVGGPWRRGDLIPAQLAIGVVERAPDGTILAQMKPHPLPGDALVSGDLLSVGSFFVPVHQSAALADDGRPLAE